ncbi:MAG TPA: sulfurtransferase TusA family protein [Pseudolabrys sp.]|nr:sulfurtransferase TusA family protein [Pseudolabrys sp.]
MGLFSKKTTAEAAASGFAVTLGDGHTYKVAQTVDCIGDSCPRPQLMTKKAMRDLHSGDVVEVVLDNPTSVEALPPMCGEMAATHLETIKDARCWKVYIRKD